MKFIQRKSWSYFPNELYHFLCWNDWQLKEVLELSLSLEIQFQQVFQFKISIQKFSWLESASF